MGDDRLLRGEAGSRGDAEQPLGQAVRKQGEGWKIGQGLARYALGPIRGLAGVV
ncbi:hypothetical protein [Streptomyces sp. NPDC048243]|uniref:hypothetical protein n=1 Tax=unclassified Streptomyces TaxID=2593676 RepID=UPI003713B39D